MVAAKVFLPAPKAFLSFSFSAYLLLLSLALPVPGIARGADTFRIGQYYSDVLNGITFISNDQAAFLLRVGWINPGGGYQDNQVLEHCQHALC